MKKAHLPLIVALLAMSSSVFGTNPGPEPIKLECQRTLDALKTAEASEHFADALNTLNFPSSSPTKTLPSTIKAEPQVAANKSCVQ